MRRGEQRAHPDGCERRRFEHCRRVSLPGRSRSAPHVLLIVARDPLRESYPSRSGWGASRPEPRHRAVPKPRAASTDERLASRHAPSSERRTCIHPSSRSRQMCLSRNHLLPTSRMNATTIAVIAGPLDPSTSCDRCDKLAWPLSACPRHRKSAFARRNFTRRKVDHRTISGRASTRMRVAAAFVARGRLPGHVDPLGSAQRHRVRPVRLTPRLGCGLGRASAEETPASPLRAKRLRFGRGREVCKGKLPHPAPVLRDVIDRLCPSLVDHTRGGEPAQGR